MERREKKEEDKDEEVKEGEIEGEEIYPFYLLSTSNCSNRNCHYEVNLNDLCNGNLQLILLMNYQYEINWLIQTCPALLVTTLCNSLSFFSSLFFF